MGRTYLWGSWDFRIGAIAGLSVGLLAEFDKAINGQATTILVTDVLLNGALLAVVLGALTILMTLFDGHFRYVVNETRGGVAGAMQPYLSVALVGAVAATVAIVGAAIWPALPHWGQSTSYGIVTLLTVWTVIGTYQLVSLTLFFGGQRAGLLDDIDDVKQLIRERQHERISA